MPLYSRKEFAALCGLEPKNLNTYIGRKKVILTNNCVDSSLEVNREFLEQRINKSENITPTSAHDQFIQYEREVPILKKKPKNDIKVQPQVNTSSDETPSDNKNQSWHELEKIKKAKDIEKTSEEIDLLKLKKDKLHGIVIPTEMVKRLFSQHTKSILVEFSNSIDKILTKIAKKKSLTNNEVAEIRKELLIEINLAVDKSIDESKKNIKTIIEEHSETRGIGEKK